MIKLSLSSIKALLRSLKGELITTIQDSNLEFILQLKLPLFNCITYVGEGKYYVYLIDALECCVVGESIKVFIEPVYKPGEETYYVGYVQGHSLTYYTSHIAGAHELEPRYLIEGINKPVLKREIPCDYFVYSFIERTRCRTQTPYEEWVINYLGALVVLSDIHNYRYPDLWSEGTLGEKYIDLVESVEDRLIDDIRAHISNHPCKT